jgi:hypothetical protein
LIFGDNLEGENCGDKTLAAKAGDTAEALIATPSNSGWMREMSIVSGMTDGSGSISGIVPRLLSLCDAVVGGDCGPKSEDLSSLLVTLIALSLGAEISSTLRVSDGMALDENVLDGFLGAGA